MTTDSTKQASEAWQDVKERLECRSVGGFPTEHYCPNCGNSMAYVWTAIEKARAADAQQIALHYERRCQAEDREKRANEYVERAGQQIAALRAENEKLFKELAYEVDQRRQVEAEYTAAELGLAEWQTRGKALEAQLTALQAEQEK